MYQGMVAGVQGNLAVLELPHVLFRAAAGPGHEAVACFIALLACRSGHLPVRVEYGVVQDADLLNGR